MCPPSRQADPVHRHRPRHRHRHVHHRDPATAASQPFPERRLGAPVRRGDLAAHVLLAPELVVIDAVPRNGLAGIEGGPHATGEPLRLAADHAGAAARQQAEQVGQRAGCSEPLNQGEIRGVEPEEHRRCARGHWAPDGEIDTQAPPPARLWRAASVSATQRAPAAHPPPRRSSPSHHAARRPSRRAAADDVHRGLGAPRQPPADASAADLHREPTAGERCEGARGAEQAPRTRRRGAGHPRPRRSLELPRAVTGAAASIHAAGEAKPDLDDGSVGSRRRYRAHTASTGLPRAARDRGRAGGRRDRRSGLREPPGRGRTGDRVPPPWIGVQVELETA